MFCGRFAGMIATPTLVVLALMYLNACARDHVTGSRTRGWMALRMGAAMARAMLP